ncbi:MAG: MFS transporter [Eubacteriales bacterium]
MNKRARNTAIGNIFIVMMAVGSYVTFSLYILPLSESLGVSVGRISIMFSIAGFTGLITSLFLGKILDFFNIKKIIVASGIMFFIFFFLLSTAKSIWFIYLGGFFSGFSQILSGYPIAQVSITWWFKKNTGKLMSMLSIGGGVSGIIMVQVVANLLKNVGLQKTAFIQGSFVSLVIILSGLFLISNHPKKYGMNAVGDKQSKETEKIIINEVKKDEQGFSDFKKQPAFWMVLSASFFIAVSITGFVTHASVYFQSTGLDVTKAALCVSAYSFARLGFAPFYGILVDKYGPGFSTALYGSATAIIFFMSFILNGLFGGIIIAVFVASSASMAAMMGAISFNKIFGGQDSNHLVGYSHAAINIGGILGSPAAGFIYDYFGSYDLFMVIAGISTMLSVILISLASSKKISPIK